MSRPSLPSLQPLCRAVAERIAIDARALAALRIAIGSIVLLDLALRSRSLVAFYTDDGIVTRAVLAETYPLHSSASVHALFGEPWWTIALFVVAGVFAVALVFGYRTRLATAATLILLVSLHARNPTVLNSGDVLLRRLLFWGALLPLGRRWSLDAVRSASTREAADALPAGGSRSVANLASLGLLLQVVLVYAVNAGSKLGSEQWFGGHAVESVLSLEGYAVGLAPVLTEFPELLALLTWAWVGLLFSAWLLLAATGRVRGLLATAFVAVHFGMLLTMDLGIFPLVSMAGLLVFLPSTVWNRLDRFGRRVPVSPPTVLRSRFPERSTSVESRSGEASSSGEALSSGEGILPRSPHARSAFHATLLALLLLSNAVAIGVVPVPESTPDELTDSSWGMFARPPTTDVWTVADGRLASGERVDALRGTPVRLDRPPDTDRYPNARWRKHLSRYPERRALSPALADYLCRQWADADHGPLETVTIVRVYGRGEARESLTRTLGRFRCTGTGATPIDGDER